MLGSTESTEPVNRLAQVAHLPGWPSVVRLVEDGKRRTERTPPRGPFPGGLGWVVVFHHGSNFKVGNEKKKHLQN